jgi:hypothetical protein
MRRSSLGLLAPLVVNAGCWVATGHAAPVANLPLTCPSASVVGQPQDTCSRLVYQLPTEDLVVLRPPPYAPIWSRAADLTASSTLAVCALPVEPGTYSSCRDASGMRRIVYLPKAQVFPPVIPPSSGARVLDLSRVPVVIAEPGVYVLDRSWRVFPGSQDGAIIITANDVTLDLQGFELSQVEAGIVSTGQDVTIRNGRVTGGAGPVIRVSGAGTLIERVRVFTSMGTVVSLAGSRSTLADSVVRGNEYSSSVAAGDGTIVRGNYVSGSRSGIRASSRSALLENELLCFGAPGDTCINVEGADNIVDRNQITVAWNSLHHGVSIRGDYNHVMGNVFFASCGPQGSSPAGGGTAIIVEGQGSTVRGNLVPARSCGGTSGWETGIAFLRDGNFYGDNIVWATVPFNLGATVQTDLGGNNGFGP